jgi:hypothetical protein
MIDRLSQIGLVSLFIASAAGVALWLALTMPEVKDFEISEEDWGL